MIIGPVVSEEKMLENVYELTQDRQMLEPLVNY